MCNDQQQHQKETVNQATSNAPDKQQTDPQWIKKYSLFMFGIGLITILFFLLISLLPQERWEPYTVVVVFVPYVLYMVLSPMLMKVHVHISSKIRSLIRAIFAANVGLMIVVILVCIFFLEPGTWPAAMIGLIPATPCFYGAWKVRQSLRSSS